MDGHLRDVLARMTNTLARELAREVDVVAVAIQSPSAENTDLTLAVQDLADDGYVSPLIAQHVLHTHRRALEGASGLAIATVAVDMCSVERCSLGETCTNTYTDGLSAMGLGSQSITYLGVASSNAYSCIQTPSPCDETSCPGPAHCVVTGSRSGEINEINERCVAECSSNPCRNGGTCTNQKPGYFCGCPRGYDGRNCEMSVASFSAESYAIVPAMKSRSSGCMSLEFRANGPGDSQLLYIGRFDDAASDFVSIDIVDGQARLMVSRGGDTQTQRVQSWESLGADDLWHSLTIDYNQTVSDVSCTIVCL